MFFASIDFFLLSHTKQTHIRGASVFVRNERATSGQKEERRRSRKVRHKRLKRTERRTRRRRDELDEIE